MENSAPKKEAKTETELEIVIRDLEGEVETNTEHEPKTTGRYSCRRWYCI